MVAYKISLHFLRVQKYNKNLINKWLLEKNLKFMPNVLKTLIIQVFYTNLKQGITAHQRPDFTIITVLSKSGTRVTFSGIFATNSSTAFIKPSQL